MTKTAIDIMAENIELPEQCYETAKLRYEDLGAFLCDDENLSKYNPKIFPQGSFRLGTAIKPLDGKADYDLDLTCRLEKGLNTTNITQKDFKMLIGKSIDNYIQKRGIKENKEEKRRCWRINYQDNVGFHMDIVPGIPLQDKQLFIESMKRYGMDERYLNKLVDMAYNITDNKSNNYEQISANWNISNPEGYAKWFEEKMKMGVDFKVFNESRYEELPSFKRKTVLQRTVQVLKRHRDIMFKNKDNLKPVSMIITTLAAMAYNGEKNVEDSVINILTKMETLLNNKTSNTRVPNPTKPEEDFADKWKENPDLEKNFYAWIWQAKADLCNVKEASSLNAVFDKAQHKFGLILNESMFANTSSTMKFVSQQPQRIEVAEPPKSHRS